MPVNRKHFKKYFDVLPAWACPSCQEGNLRKIEETETIRETGPSRASHDHEAWDPDWIVERFSVILECSNTLCKELVVVSGNCSYEQDYYYDQNGNPDSSYNRYFEPMSITPSPPLFRIQDEIPADISEELKKSFGMIWVDHASCLNRLRVCVELLLNERKVQKTFIAKSGKREKLSLHKRIEKYKLNNSESSELLMALKWLGNLGIHGELAAIEIEKIIDAFDIFEHALDDIYTTRRAKLLAKAKVINKHRGLKKKSSSKTPFSF